MATADQTADTREPADNLTEIIDRLDDCVDRLNRAAREFAAVASGLRGLARRTLGADQ